MRVHSVVKLLPRRTRELFFSAAGEGGGQGGGCFESADVGLGERGWRGAAAFQGVYFLLFYPSPPPPPPFFSSFLVGGWTGRGSEAGGEVWGWLGLCSSKVGGEPCPRPGRVHSSTGERRESPELPGFSFLLLFKSSTRLWLFAARFRVW